MDQWDYTNRMLDILNNDNSYTLVSRNEINISYRKIDYIIGDNLLQGLIDVDLYNFFES